MPMDHVYDVVKVDDDVCCSSSDLRGGPVVDNNNPEPEPEPHQESGSEGFKTQIANHPLYPTLLSAYIDCRKVGAPPAVASVLEEISRENHLINIIAPLQIGNDPELDHFMESYCQLLGIYKEEFSRPFHEATLFLSNIESQLSNLCKGITFTTSSDCRSDDVGVSSGEEYSCGELEAVFEGGSVSCGNTCQGDKEIKEMLLRKYSGYVGSLRKEFLKRRKKGKLPKDARITLLNWWNTHSRWPYPTEEEKLKLSEISGLNQKQINNWFINQRKRHWKPSEDIRFGIMEGVSEGGPIFFDSGVPPKPQSHHH